MNYQALIGRMITGHEVSKDNETLTLILDDGTRAYLETSGECCSCTWIESLDMPQNLLGKILSVEDIKMPDLGNISTPKKPFVDQVAYYGLKIITERGHCVIDYSNDSNGYYGGSIHLRMDSKGTKQEADHD